MHPYHSRPDDTFDAATKRLDFLWVQRNEIRQHMPQLQPVAALARSGIWVFEQPD